VTSQVCTIRRIGGIHVFRQIRRPQRRKRTDCGYTLSLLSPSSRIAELQDEVPMLSTHKQGYLAEILLSFSKGNCYPTRNPVPVAWSMERMYPRLSYCCGTDLKPVVH
jgi:hypothetical protein